MNKPPPFARVVAAAATPFRDDLSVDQARMTQHVRWLLANGCDGVVMFGSTGESASLTQAERHSIVQELRKADIPAASLLIGTGCSAIEDTIALTRMALSFGVAGALVHPPFFFKGVSDEGVELFYRRVIDGVGDARLRLYLYHYPQAVGVGISLQVVDRLFTRYPTIIAGYKDSSGNFDNTCAVTKNFSVLDVFVATEARYQEFRKAGGAGCVSATANVQPAAIARLEQSLGTPAADAAQASVARMRKALEGPQVIGNVKTLLSDIHGDAQWLTVRPPLVRLTDPEIHALRERVRGAA